MASNTEELLHLIAPPHRVLVAQSDQRAAIGTLEQQTANEVGTAALALTTRRTREFAIDRIILPRIGGMSARDVNAADIVGVIEAAGQRHSTHTADKTFSTLAQIIKHGLARHVMTTDPTAGLSVKAIVGKPEPIRERLKLSEDELRVLLPALRSLDKADELAIRILLGTGIHISELIQAKWQHVDFEQGTWTIPDAHSKTGKGFVIPLVPTIAGWFRELHTLARGSDFVLPARKPRRHREENDPVGIRTVTQMIEQLRTQLAGQCRPFSAHDLRSTCRSWLSALGINPLVAERYSNHRLPGLLAVYDQHDYIDERRAGMQLWIQFLQTAERGKKWNVTSMPERKPRAA